MNCKHCGSKMMGDGFKEVFHCEHVFIDVPVTPDADPIFCGPEDHGIYEEGYLEPAPDVEWMMGADDKLPF